jgi:hypothetical protein
MSGALSDERSDLSFVTAIIRSLLDIQIYMFDAHVSNIYIQYVQGREQQIMLFLK